MGQSAGSDRTDMKLLVTGGAGFIYSNVARYFVRKGHDVTICDHFDVQGKGRNLADIMDKVSFIFGSVLMSK